MADNNRMILIAVYPLVGKYLWEAIEVSYVAGQSEKSVFDAKPESTRF